MNRVGQSGNGYSRTDPIIKLLGAFIDGGRREDDAWMVDSALLIRYREVVGPVYPDPATERRDIEDIEHRLLLVDD